MFERLLPALVSVVALAPEPPAAAQTGSAPAPLERLTFEEAVKRATDRHPTVGQAAQAILRAEALLDQARSVFRPSVYGVVGTTILDAARAFDGNITQPRTQSTFNATLSYPFLAAASWASPPRSPTSRSWPPSASGTSRCATGTPPGPSKIIPARAWRPARAAG